MVEGDEDYAAICAVPADHPNLTCVGRPDPSFFLQAQCVHFETHEHVKTLNRLGGAAVAQLHLWAAVVRHAVNGGERDGH